MLVFNMCCRQMERKWLMNPCNKESCLLVGSALILLMTAYEHISKNMAKLLVRFPSFLDNLWFALTANFIFSIQINYNIQLFNNTIN